MKVLSRELVVPNFIHFSRQFAPSFTDPGAEPMLLFSPVRYLHILRDRVSTWFRVDCLTED